MAKRRTGTSQTKEHAGLWESLTWEDLGDWAGERSVSRGRSYQRQGRVEDLVVSDDGRLLATVSGGERYVTSVWCTEESSADFPIESTCTCPVGYDGCKHAVAVVAEYLMRLVDAEDVPAADVEDPRWLRLEGGADEDEWDDEFDEEGELEDAGPDVFVRSKPSRWSRKEWDGKIAEHIRAKSREELAEFVISLTERFPALHEEFRERISLSEGDVDRLVAEARKKMCQQTAEIGWRNSWTGEGHTPDYSGFRHRLERLVEMSHADAVVDLGREFMGRTMSQMAQSHDEGETGMAIAECLPVIFTAVTQSSLSGAEQLLFAIDAYLQEDYDVIGDSAVAILDGDWTAADWSEVAEVLQNRLNDLSADDEQREDSFSRNYARDRISGWLLDALQNAGREGELRDVYEAEARNTGSYVRLVRYLIEAGEIDDALGWAQEGIAKTREKWPGIAADLAGLMCEVARKRKQWDIVAAHAACGYFERPSRHSFDGLLKAARKAKCVQKVRTAALAFLETGELPIRRIPQGKGKDRTFRIEPLPEWPLPVLEYLAFLLPVARQPQAHYDVLLDMAIAEKKPDVVLHWYEKLTEGRRSSGGYGGRYYGASLDDQVAAAVAKSHPERALQIYVDGVNANLTHADPSAYERVATYLKKMRPILKKLDREAEWTELVGKLREDYKRRRLFVEALDRLEGRTIVQSRRIRRR